MSNITNIQSRGVTFNRSAPFTHLSSAAMNSCDQYYCAEEVTMTDRVLIVDFGSQLTQLIARRVRDSGVYCEIHPCTKVDAAFIARFAPRAVILSGGPASVTETHTPRAHPAL